MQKRTFVFKNLAAEHDVHTFYRSASILPYAVVPSTTGAGRQSSPHPVATSHDERGASGERVDEGHERPAVLDLELEEQEESRKREREREQEEMAAEEKPTLANVTATTDQEEREERPTQASSSDDHRVLFLLGGEVRLKNKRRGFGMVMIDESDLYWSDFGGKREPTDRDPIDTALREFDEETAGIFEDHLDLIRDRMRSDRSLKVWNGLGFSVLFLVEVPYLPHASPTFFQRFDERIVELMQETQAKLALAIQGQPVTVPMEVMGTLNKCAVRWVDKEDFVRLFDMLPPRRGRETNETCYLTTTTTTKRGLPPTTTSPTSLPSSPSPSPSSSSSSLPSTATTPAPPPSASTTSTTFTMQMYPYFLEYLRSYALQDALECLPDVLPLHSAQRSHAHHQAAPRSPLSRWPSAAAYTSSDQAPSERDRDRRGYYAPREDDERREVRREEEEAKSRRSQKRKKKKPKKPSLPEPTAEEKRTKMNEKRAEKRKAKKRARLAAGTWKQKSRQERCEPSSFDQK